MTAQVNRLADIIRHINFSCKVVSVLRRKDSKGIYRVIKGEKADMAMVLLNRIIEENHIPSDVHFMR